MQRAVNPQTGEVVFLVDNQWVKPAQAAKNPQTGEMAYLVGGQWQIIPGVQQPTVPAATPGLGMSDPIFGASAQDIEPVTPAAPVATAPKAPPPAYKSRLEALDDAVNLLEEGAGADKVREAFGRIGIPFEEIVAHGQRRKSEYFAPQKIQPVTPPVGAPTPVSEAPELKAYETTIPEDIANLAIRAKERGAQAVSAILADAGVYDKDQLAQVLAQQERRLQAAAPPPSIQAGIEEIGKSKTYTDAAIAMATNPAATFTMLTESLLMTAPVLATAVARLPAAAFGAGVGMFSGATEYGSVLADVLAERGIDMLNAEDIGRALQDPKVIEEIRDKGVKRGLTIGIIDGLTAGFAGKFIAPVNRSISAGNLAGRDARNATIGAWAKETGLQVGGGAGGEFAAQKLTGEDRPAEVLLEGVFGAATAPIEARANLQEARQREAIKNLLDQIQAPPEAPAAAPPRVAPTPPAAVAPTEAPEVAPSVTPPPATETVTETGVPTEEAFAPEPGVTTRVEAPATTLAAEPPTPVDQKEVNQFRQEQQRIESNLEEPKKVEGAVSGMPIVAVRVDSLKLSDDVPQFKSETEPLEGTFDTTGVGPIQVWERLNGDLEVISGRHRFDLAQRSGTPAIYAQIHREADGFSAQQASTLDALLNIRDNQGKTKDYVTFFKLSGIPEEEAKLQGFLGRSLGKRSFAISSKGSDALITAHRNDLISDEQAFTIAQNAPGNEGLQAVGIRAAQEGATLPRIANIMEAAKADPSGMPDATQDLFGFDDSYFKRLEQMSRIATQKQKDLEARISAISGASRKPELARAEGIDVKDPEAVKKRVGELKQQLAAWKSWSSNPELRSEIDAELAGKEIGFESVTGPKIGIDVRLRNAANRFRDMAMEQFGLTEQQADSALGTLMKYKVVKLDPVMGQFTVKDGRFMDREVLLRAAAEGGVEVEARPALELKAETAEETVARQEREAKEKVERDQQTIADRERDLFKLETQAAERGEMATPDMFGGRDLANQPAPKPVKLTKQESDTLDLFGDDSMFNSLWTYSGETPAFTNTVQRLLKMLESGRITEDQFATRVEEELSKARQSSREKREEAALRPKVRGELRIRAVLLEAARRGFITEDAARLAEWFISQNPALVDDLGISLRKGEAGVGGRYLPVSRIAVLMKNNNDRGTTVHEILHHLERMMPEKIRKAIQKSWLKSLGKAYQKAINGDDANLKHFYQLITDFHSTGNVKLFNEATEMIKEGEVGIEHYQHVNPSEFWAVNATRILEGRFDVRGDRLGALKKWLSEMFQYLKSVFGLQSDAPIMKALRSLAKSDGEFVSSHMLSKGAGFQSLSPEEQLLEKHKRPNTPVTEPQGVKGFVINAANESKRIFLETANSPIVATKRFFTGLDQGITKFRNTNTFFGTGLSLADQQRYAGNVKTTAGLATASLAVDNALRSGNIAVQVIMRGMLKFNTSLQNYIAENSKYSMANIYKAERDLKKKLGKQVGQDIINSYLEAKRSRSIENEFLDRTNAYETMKQDVQDAEDNLNRLIKSNASAANIDGARTLLAKLQEEAKALEKELDNITLVKDKVTMTEEAIDEFIALDKVHPELRTIMDNWTGVNNNLLDVYHEVGLLSDNRYKALKGIKDYVPWQRIRLPDEDVHDPIQATTRTLTNIGREKLFKKGIPQMSVEFVAKQGQKTFDVDPDMVIVVEINGKKINKSLVTVTPDGKVQINATIPQGAMVRFKGIRPVDNIITNMTNNVVTMTINAIRQHAANRIVEQYAERDPKGKIKRYPKEDLTRGVFKYNFKGRPTFVRIEDPLIAQAAIGMESMIIGVDNIFSALSNIFRRSITLSGFFQLKQVFKDGPTAAFVTGVNNPTELVLRSYMGFVKALRAKDPAIDLLSRAGIGGYFTPARSPESEVKLRINVINQSIFSYAMRALDAFGDASDMAQRYGVYTQTIKEGGDPAQALFKAANVINFKRHGSGAAAQASVRLVAFMGAWINSIEVLAQAFAGGGLRGGTRKEMAGKLLKVGGIFATYTILYTLLLAADDDYWELDDQTRLRNFIVPFSKKLTGEMIMTPMNTGAAFFFKALPEMLTINVIKNFSKDPIDVRRLRTALTDAMLDMILGPEPVPAGVKPVMEIAMDRSFFTERSITPKRLENVEAAEQYTAATSEVGKLFSYLTSVPGTSKRVLNPMEADHLIRGIFGTVGATVMWSSNLIAGGERPAMTTKEMPGVGGFVAPTVPRGREDLFYDLKEKTDKAYGTFKKKVDRMKQEEQFKYLDDNWELIALHTYSTQVNALLTKINSEVNRIAEADAKSIGMTPEERRAEMIRLQQMKAMVLQDIDYWRGRAFGTKMFDRPDLIKSE